jgi:YVTN family beta-propeller protein
MKKLVTVGFFILFFTIHLFSQDYIYVLNGLAETISVINIETGEVENHVVTVGAIPNQVVYHEGLLYVVNSGSASLQVIDPVNFNTVANVPLEINSYPWNVAFVNGYAFVTGFATASVYKIDLVSMLVVDTFGVGQAPEGIIACDGKLFVANTGFNPDDYTFGQGTVTILDPQSGSNLANVDVGKNPQALVVSPGEMINIVCTGNYSSIRGMIYFLEAEGYSVIDSLAIGGDPYWPVINSSGICFVSAGGWSADGYVFNYDAVARIVLRDEDNPIIVGTGAMGLAIDSLGMLYSAGQTDNSVTEFNDQGEVQATYPVGSGPMSLTISDSRTFVEDNVAIIPDNIKLGKPYPNPFNVSIVLPLIGDVDELMGVIVEIYDSNGRFVCGLNLDKKYSINRYIRWDGASFAGNGVSSGVYFARLRGTSQTVRMVLLR